MDELWHTRVFASERALGSATGVVLSQTPLGEPDLKRLATRLGFDLTVFLPPDGTLRSVRAFATTGTERPRSLQATLATKAVLQRRSTQPRTWSPSPNTLWTRLPELTSPVQAPLAPLAQTLGRAPPGRFCERVIDGRYFRQVSDPASLELLTLRPEQAWSYLRPEGLAAVCLYAWSAPEELALRVFDASLTGREATTSAEVLSGLVQCLQADDGSGTLDLTVQQGSGPARVRSTLRVRRRKGETTVGGQVTLLGHGWLLDEANQGRLAC